ncbi:hypothetical protein FHS31_002648 [Sphingomonas vulcanisoli]|uniref:Uncharacterized protein n=1 Tax=Sphingomonas vulcanisoli TaxID=1658060 RepID=A0ABX0TVH5_9SPHN|nr:hypothetical protein [Sphingomonas vulcanisoli]NIJ09018.1 hypothetical protein [Sphingomonas vulcanisoli]
MDAAAKLITAVAALIGAIAWPAAFAAIVIAFRRDLSSAVTRLPSLVDRVRKVSFPGVGVELDSLADKASETGEITIDQARTAGRLEAASKEFGAEDLFRELDKLCLEYDSIRRTMSSGSTRTREMTRIIVKMRALGPSTSSRIETYKGSGSAGSRLAAIAMMQMEPIKADIDWLQDRFRTEAPFLFYHAALALTNAAGSRSGASKVEVIEAGKKALATIRSFDGPADQGTLDVLKALVGR